MHRMGQCVAATFAILLLAAGMVSTATASHPSRELWTVKLQSVAGPECLLVTKDDSQEGVLEIENLCEQKFAIDQLTCSPELCDLEPVEIEAGASKTLGPRSFGLDSSKVQEGESIYLEFTPTLGGNEQPTMALEFTFDGWSDASHGTADTGPDAGKRSGDTDGAQTDVAASSDAEAGAGEGDASDGADEDAGCSAVGHAPLSPLVAWMLVATGLAVKTRNRG